MERCASRLRGFVMSLPINAHEKHVDECHSILNMFKASCDRDFSSFYIPKEALSDTQHRPIYEPTRDPNKYCDPVLFRSRVYGLVSFAALQIQDLKPKSAAQPAQKSADPKELASQIFIKQMSGSQIVQNSPNTSIKNTCDPKSSEFKELAQTSAYSSSRF